MQTLAVLSDNEYLLNMWYNVFKIASDAQSIDRYLVDDFDPSLLEIQEFPSFVIIGNDLTLEKLKDLLLLIKRYGIPVIISKNMVDRSVSELIGLGIKSVVDIDMSILTISHTLRIVESGGIYLNPLEIKKGVQQ